jgi:xanthine dehydrogenase YagS FAD-binding subunit
MQTFEWVDARTVREAASFLTAAGLSGPAVAKAGGVDLVDLLKEGIVRPSRVVNLKTIPGLDGIALDRSGALSLGAMVTLAHIESAPAIQRSFPALAAAARHAATPQVRNAATIGGNLLQRPRCWYFRSAHFYDEGGDPTSLALEGQNQYHAIFDNASSAMVHASTPATALIAYGAEVTLEGADGQPRTVRLADFLLPPDARRSHDADILPGEILTAVNVPAPQPGTRSSYHKQTERESYDWPICDVAVSLAFDGGRVREATIVLGWVAPTPRLALESAKILIGNTVTEESARAAATAAVAGATPLSRNAYKIPVLETVIRRTILAAAAARGDAS